MDARVTPDAKVERKRTQDAATDYRGKKPVRPNKQQRLEAACRTASFKARPSPTPAFTSTLVDVAPAASIAVTNWQSAQVGATESRAGIYVRLASGGRQRVVGKVVLRSCNLHDLAPGDAVQVVIGDFEGHTRVTKIQRA